MDLTVEEKMFFDRIEKEFLDYVQNGIPIRFIYVKEMRLVDRAFVQQHYLPRVRRLRTNPVTLEFIEHTSSTKPRMQAYLQTVVKYDMLSHSWLLAPTAIKFYDSNWQPLYGEGGDRAFCRLVEAIMLASGDSTVLNWCGGAADLHNSNAMPHSPIAYLCGFPHDDYLWSTEGLDMAMTSRGLQVQLLILPMKLRKHICVMAQVLPRTTSSSHAVSCSFIRTSVMLLPS
ncbi:hypothetical protein QC762_205625 [Podospora pseudocomata]|uniref:Uncharacterized protein n=1 Tax=Podospora pseudocomata TaxID=2093779 RepID=A0ABR0GLN0_9PEZI|nr:hypothetical protein QC762_205625 [Podospora pseudocomata]